MNKVLLAITSILLLFSCENGSFEPAASDNPIEVTTEDPKVFETVSYNPNQEAVIGEQVPNFVMNGGTEFEKSIRDFRGKVVMLQFEAEWCSVCKIVNPRVIEASNTLDTNKYAIIKIYMDYTKEQFDEKSMLPNIGYFHLYNSPWLGEDLGVLFKINSVPRSVIINEEGILIDSRSTSQMNIIEELPGYSID